MLSRTLPLPCSFRFSTTAPRRFACSPAARMRAGIDRRGGYHPRREARVVLAQLSLADTLGQQMSDVMHQDTSPPERRRTALDRIIRDDQSGAPVTALSSAGENISGVATTFLQISLFIRE